MTSSLNLPATLDRLRDTLCLPAISARVKHLADDLIAQSRQHRPPEYWAAYTLLASIADINQDERSGRGLLRTINGIRDLEPRRASLNSQLMCRRGAVPHPGPPTAHSPRAPPVIRLHGHGLF
ncbi:MAG: hypothetical protein WKF30_10250 [Pyrinomonadaceae bacterium]